MKQAKHLWIIMYLSPYFPYLLSFYSISYTCFDKVAKNFWQEAALMVKLSEQTVGVTFHPWLNSVYIFSSRATPPPQRGCASAFPNNQDTALSSDSQMFLIGIMWHTGELHPQFSLFSPLSDTSGLHFHRSRLWLQREVGWNLLVKSSLF